jgi:hypothetical protein
VLASALGYLPIDARVWTCPLQTGLPLSPLPTVSVLPKPETVYLGTLLFGSQRELRGQNFRPDKSPGHVCIFVCLTRGQSIIRGFCFVGNPLHDCMYFCYAVVNKFLLILCFFYLHTLCASMISVQG